MLTIRLKAKLTCPKHPRFNPEQGEGGIVGGCVVCFAILDVYFKFQKLNEFIRRAEGIIGAPASQSPIKGMTADL
jgi:hypothetical protein